jgi:hypothetical protein
MADRYSNRPPIDDGGDRGFRRQPDGEGDPLAELARLIGQTDPQSSFAKGRQAGAPKSPRSLATDFSAGPPSWLHAAQANRQPEQVDDLNHEVDDTPVLSPMPSFLQPQHLHAQYQDPSHAQHHGASRYDDVLYGQQQQEHYDDQYQDDQAYQDEHYADEDALANRPAFLEEGENRRRGGGLLTVAVVIGLAVVGTAGAYAYRSYTGAPRSGEAPVIKADTSPSKVVPPTQSSDGSGKAIYDRIGSAGPEKVVSREEQPVDVSSASARVVFPPLNQANSPSRSLATATPVPPAPTASADGANGATSDEPRKIRTVPIRPDQSGAAAQAKAAPAPTPVRTTPVRSDAPAQQQAGNGPMQLTPSASSSSVRSASAAVPPASASSNPAPASVTPSGGYLVQIASQKTEAEAQASYRSTQAKFANLLGSMSPIIKRADLGEKGVFYRALVGPFANSEEATRLCTNLKIAGGSCLIQRN